MTDLRTKAAEERRRRNAELAGKVKRGERIEAAVSQEALFFPPRPIIKKDKREMARVLGEGE